MAGSRDLVDDHVAHPTFAPVRVEVLARRRRARWPTRSRSRWRCRRARAAGRDARRAVVRPPPARRRRRLRCGSRARPRPARSAVTRGRRVGFVVDLELDVVDLADQPPVAVDELAVEQLEHGPASPVRRQVRGVRASLMIPPSSRSSTGSSRARRRRGAPCRTIAIVFFTGPFTLSPMYVRSLATTRIGKYVSGSAAAESTIEYSVTLIGIDRGDADDHRDERSRPARRGGTAHASRGRTSLPHCQPKYCDIVYPHDSAVSSAAPNVHATKPTMMKASPTLPSASDVGSATCERLSTPIPSGWNTSAAPAIRPSERSPPSGKPRNTLARFRMRSDRVHFSSTAPDEKKNTS